MWWYTGTVGVSYDKLLWIFVVVTGAVHESPSVTFCPTVLTQQHHLNYHKFRSVHCPCSMMVSGQSHGGMEHGGAVVGRREE